MGLGPVPVRIRRLDGGARVEIQWDERGHVVSYPARLLRLSCQCALCVQEMSGEPMLDPDSVPGDVVVERVSHVGGYAAHFRFSDGHSTGIYAWDLLYAICPCEGCEERRHGGTEARGHGEGETA